ncbi:MAG: translation initiation factor IF-5A [Candidatus Odinarchaeia archaeon]
MSKKMAEAGSLKTGKFILVNGEPCKIVNVEKSKAGKHGHAKVRVTAIGLFDGGKRSLVFPSTAQVEVPLIDKRSGQIISVSENNVMVMDLDSYETFEMPLPDEEELKNKLDSGVQVEFWDIVGRKKIVRVKSG